MESTPHIEDTRSLDELIETHLQALFDKLARPHTLEEIKDDLAPLNDLIYFYKRRDEILEKLLDSSTSKASREKIRAALQAQHIAVAENVPELERLHAKSHQLLERSLLLISKAQWQINREAYKYSGYALEVCGFCKGFGRSNDEKCSACKGKGNVLVHHPATKCLRCKGIGQTNSTICNDCRGTGWMMAATES